MNAGRLNFLVLVMIAALLPGMAAAVNVLSMRDLPIQHMTDEDRDILTGAVVSALERSSEGTTTRWENPKTGAHGELTPRASFDRAGRPCRELEVANSARGFDNRVVLTLCKQSDGEWKVEGQ